MTTPEGAVKKQIRALLAEYGADVYTSMPVQNGMGTPMLDFHVCVNGNYLAIEAKKPGGTLTARQTLTKEAIEAAGGTVLVVSDQTGLDALEAWLDANTP
jgi:hypothetical protein